MSLAPFVQIVARGKGRSRTMTFEEAREAMSIMLHDDTPPEAIGALLMVMRLRGEVAAEIAGFTAALQNHAPLPAADLDWPSYAAGRSRGAPLFLLSAKLVANAGYRVSLHGHNSHQRDGTSVHDTLRQCNLIGDGLDYAPLATLSPRALQLLKLRDTLGLRSCVNTVLRMWNPSSAPATVQGVFHPSYRGLQATAGVVLGRQNMSIIKGGGGEFERNPAKAIEVYGLRNGTHFQDNAAPIVHAARKLHEPDQAIDASDLWFGAAHDAFALATVIGTAALALWTVGAAGSIDAGETLANDLWSNRHAKKRISA